jgi:hypothetical protein
MDEAPESQETHTEPVAENPGVAKAHTVPLRQRGTFAFIATAAVVTALVLGSSLVKMNAAPKLTFSSSNERAASSTLEVVDSGSTVEFVLAESAVKAAGRSDAFVLDAAASEARDMLAEEFGLKFEKISEGFSGSAADASAIVRSDGSWSFFKFEQLPAPCAEAGKLPAPEDVTVETLVPVPDAAAGELELPKDAVRCVTPQQGAPTDTKVRDMAKKFFDRFSAPTLGDILVTYGSATAEVLVDGSPSGLSWSVRFDKDGEIVSASGVSGRFVKLGSYPTLSTKDAVQRLNDPKWAFASLGAARDLQMAPMNPVVGSSSASVTAVPASSVPPVVNTTPLDPDDVISSPPPPDGDPKFSPPPFVAPDSSSPPGTYIPDTVPPVFSNTTSRTVTFSRAELRLSAHTAEIDGEARTVFVPTWWFFAESGENRSVIAISGDDVALLDTPVTEPAPTTPSDRPAGGPPQLGTNEFEVVRSKVVGMTEVAAVKAAEKAGMQVRVAMRDGESFMQTMDYSDSRLNIVVENGVVTSAGIG